MSRLDVQELPQASVVPITLELLEALQALIGTEVSRADIEKVNRGDWLLVHGEVTHLEYQPNDALSYVLLSFSSDGGVLLTAGLGDLGLELATESMPPIIQVQNLEEYATRLVDVIELRLRIVGICDLSTHKLTILTIYAPEERMLALEMASPRLVPPVQDGDSDLLPPLPIQLRYAGRFTALQQEVLEWAALRWGEVLRDGWPPAIINDAEVDVVTIIATARILDGETGALGLAKPTHLRQDSGLPVRGVMEFDSEDLVRLEANGTLETVILHEMAHVLGFGSLWSSFQLLSQVGSDDPVYMGSDAMREYALLLGDDITEPVPVENMGGMLTQEGHWRELVFGNELMTGFLGGGPQPLSRLTIAAFADLGYVVNYEAADPYQLPTEMDIESMGVRSGQRRLDRCYKCQMPLLGVRQMN